MSRQIGPVGCESKSISKDQGRRVMESSDSIQGLSTLESLRGSELPRILPSVWPAIPCRYRVGSTDLSRLTRTVLPPSRAMSLTRQGISLIDLFHMNRPYGTSGVFLSRSLLHVAMQMGLYLHRGESRCLASSL